ncbi:MAG: molybdate ABC transporter permease subunit [Pseudomonadota bacterium]
MDLLPRGDETAALWLSMQVALLCTVVLTVPSIVVGTALARWHWTGKSVVEVLIHLPLVLPPVATGYLMLLALGPRTLPGGMARWILGHDLAFSLAAAVLAAAVVSFPLAVRSIRLAVELVDRRLEQAASTLGASPVDVWWSVTLPLALPGVLTGLVLAFTRSLGEFGATIVFAGNIAGETRTLPLSLFTATQVPGGESAALRLMLLSVSLSFVTLLASEWMALRLRRRLGAAA